MIATSFGLLLARLIVGLAIASHGSQKLFGAFGGPGFAGASGFMESLGYRPGKLFALMACLGEIGGGLLTVFGIGGPLGPALIIVVMIVAAFSVHVKNGFFTSGGGYELNTIYIAAALALAFGGFGGLSLDRALGLERFYTPSVTWIVIAVAVIIAVLNLAAKRPVVAVEHQSE